MTALRRFAAGLALSLSTALLGAAAHPSPKVVLIKHADYIRQTLAGATQYFVRTVDIGKQDLAAIRQKSDFTPDDPDVEFYLGQGGGGAPVGVVLFQQVDTPHGPLEVGLTFKPDGSIARAGVTTATVETKPWVQEAGVEVLNQPFCAQGNVATAGGCMASAYLAAWIIARSEGRDAAAAALHYVAPVGEKDAYVANALKNIAPYLPR